MLILFDHSTPVPLRCAFMGHVVVEGVERGWALDSDVGLIHAS